MYPLELPRHGDSMSTLNIPLFYKGRKDPLLSVFASLLELYCMINPHWLDLILPRINFHGPEDV